MQALQASKEDAAALGQALGMVVETPDGPPVPVPTSVIVAEKLRQVRVRLGQLEQERLMLVGALQVLTQVLNDLGHKEAPNGPS